METFEKVTIHDPSTQKSSCYLSWLCCLVYHRVNFLEYTEIFGKSDLIPKYFNFGEIFFDGLGKCRQVLQTLHLQVVFMLSYDSELICSRK